MSDSGRQRKGLGYGAGRTILTDQTAAVAKSAMTRANYTRLAERRETRLAL